MGKYNFEQKIDRHGTRSTKWDMGAQLIEAGMADRFDEDTISVFTADMDFLCPPAIVEGMQKITNQKIYGYTQMDADLEYRDAVCSWHKRRYGWNIKPEEITYVNGTLNAMIRAVLSFTKPGDQIVIQRPVYSPFQMVIENAGRKLLDNHLKKEENYYTMDLEDLEEKLADENTTMMFLCNPHNPVGRVWRMEELNEVCRLCRKYNIVLVADEIHADLIRCNETFIPCAMAEEKCTLITCTGINKTFNVAGLQCTNVIISDEKMRNKYQNELLAQVGPVVPTPFAIEAVIQAYTNCDEWLEEVKEYLDENMRWVEEFLKEKLPKVGFRIPEGTYVIWLDFSAYGTTEEAFHRLSANANVVMDKGTKYGEEGRIRACIPISRSVLQEMFGRMYTEFGADML